MEECYLKHAGALNVCVQMRTHARECFSAWITYDVNFARVAGALVKDYLQNNLASLPSTSYMSEQIAPWEM